MNRRPNTHCSVCEKPIYRRPSQITSGSVYCSNTCNGIAQRSEQICPICSTAYIGRKKTCSRTCANKSRAGISYTGKNKSNKAVLGGRLKEQLAKLRGGTCERCGENNYAILQVHHKTERYRGGTDDVKNLELLCPNCHMTHHYGKSLYHEKKML